MSEDLKAPAATEYIFHIPYSELQLLLLNFGTSMALAGKDIASQPSPPTMHTNAFVVPAVAKLLERVQEESGAKQRYTMVDAAAGIISILDNLFMLIRSMDPKLSDAEYQAAKIEFEKFQAINARLKEGK